MKPIPVTVLIVTRNEAPRIGRCLEALQGFGEIIVVDSRSTDATPDIARKAGAKLVTFEWDGRYPKKRQWCLDRLPLSYDWVFFVDADEEVTAELRHEIARLFDGREPPADGYFVRGRYVLEGRLLRHGLANNKLCLFDRRKIGFPDVNDLDLPGMGEIEGHYQPVPHEAGAPLGQLEHALRHHAYVSRAGWEARHARYAAWERGMNAKNAWPEDPVPWRQALKLLFRRLPCRGVVAFFHCYIWKRGALDGKPGFELARDRWRYYRLIGRH